MYEFVSLPAGLKDERWQNSFHNFLFKCNRFLHFLRQQEPMTQRDSFQLIFERYLEKEEQIFQTPNVNLNMNKPIREGNSQKLLESNERLTSSSLSTNQLINSHTTTSHLGPHVHKCRRYAVAQDKLRSHWAKLVRQWFNDHGLKLLDWPPHSPEFNAIENVWHSLKETVKTAQPKTQAELEVAVDQACHLISHVSTLIKEEASN
ncbi:unnamed protein product [Rotaria sp. Silwood1]|nr:unnamed protein product [Rotaria sp. Silwood1]